MRHYSITLAFVIILVAFLNISAGHGFDIEKIYGHWGAHSKTYFLFDGDMVIDNEAIIWDKHGVVKYKIIQHNEDVVFLELDKEINCGNIVQLGPIHYYSKRLIREEIEVAFYSSKEDAFAPNPKDYKSQWNIHELVCSWGIYSR